MYGVDRSVRRQNENASALLGGVVLGGGWGRLGAADGKGGRAAE